jgi:hypothetical protein
VLDRNIKSSHINNYFDFLDSIKSIFKVISSFIKTCQEFGIFDCFAIIEFCVNPIPASLNTKEIKTAMKTLKYFSEDERARLLYMESVEREREALTIKKR